MNNKTFNPLEWAQGEPTSDVQPHVENNNETQGGQVSNMITGDFSTELQKAQLITEELLSMGANIAETYDDYLKLGFALSHGLGDMGREIYHKLCAQSSKYSEAACEKKWQECMTRHDGRTTIATFYKMAQDAGVNLSEVGRRFPSNPSFPSKPQFPQGCVSGQQQPENRQNGNNQLVNIQMNKSKNMTSTEHTNASSHGGEETEEMRFSFSLTFSQNIDPEKLPVTLQRAVANQKTPTDKDKVLLSALDLLAIAEPNVYGIYGGKRVYTPFYLFIIGPAGIGQKGIIADTKQMLMPIDEAIRTKYYAQVAEYKEQHAKWETAKQQRGKGAESAGVEPEEPEFRRLFVSADSSAAAFKQDLYNFGGRGFVFSTEADTLSQALGQEWGQFTDVFRQAFHHESIESTRAKEKLRIVIDEPQLGILITCTPKQITELLSPKQNENGTSSRDIFYCTKGCQEWIDPFQAKEPTADYYYEIGKEVKKMYDLMESRSKSRVQILLTEKQQMAFNDHFKPLLPEQIGLYGEDFAAFVVRIALVAFRMMMVLTTLRNFEQGNLSDLQQQAFVCTDDDYQTAMTIIDCLVQHTAYVYNTLLRPADDVKLAIKPMNAREKQLYLALPDEFVTKQFNDTSHSLGIPLKSAQRYLGNFISQYQLIKRTRQGHYSKIRQNSVATDVNS